MLCAECIRGYRERDCTLSLSLSLSFTSHGPVAEDRDFIRNCRFGVFQYVICKIIVTLLTLIFVVRPRHRILLACLVSCSLVTAVRMMCGHYQKADVYGEGNLSNFKEGFVYMTVINNVSQIVRVIEECACWSLKFAPRPSVCVNAVHGN
jgi:hypothetical protein